MHARFYTLLKSMPGVTKEDIVAQYDPSGSLSTLYTNNRRMYAKMLTDMERAIGSDQMADGDKWRKMVIRCIARHFELEGRYLDMTRQERLEIIKSTAARSAKIDDFNSIPVAKLRQIYNTFKNKY